MRNHSNCIGDADDANFASQLRHVGKMRVVNMANQTSQRTIKRIELDKLRLRRESQIECERQRNYNRTATRSLTPSTKLCTKTKLCSSALVQNQGEIKEDNKRATRVRAGHPNFCQCFDLEQNYNPQLCTAVCM